MATFSNNLVAKNGKSGNQEYYCEKCDYTCYKKYNWTKHITTAKHSKMPENAIFSTEKWQKVAHNTVYCCEKCGKEYSDRTGLWRHKKNCMNNIENTIDKKDEIIDRLLQQNSRKSAARFDHSHWQQ